MIIKGATVLDDQWAFSRQDILLSGSLIADIQPAGSDVNCQDHSGNFPASDSEVIDATGLTVIPGIVDIHIHGCNGFDFCDLDVDAIGEMSRYLGRQGVTSFIGTTMAFDEPRLERIFRSAIEAIDANQFDGAQLRGIHMEGPFFAKAKKGAQSEKFIIDPDLAMFLNLSAIAGEQLRILDVAPELPGAIPMIRQAAPTMTVSLAHTVADYETASLAFANGASHVTHLFNAMQPFSHREPGVIGAASDAGATVEVICDGIHLHPSVIRAVFKWFGEDKVVLVSDAMRACGLPEGDYALGGQAVHVEQGKATLADGTIAGSATNLVSCLRNAIKFGIPAITAIKAATINPARTVGIDHLVGSISIGKQADLILLDQQLAVVQVIRGGRKLL